MVPKYNPKTRELVIEWLEEKKDASPIHHHFISVPLLCQLHPKYPDKLLKAHFNGKMPKWIKKYAEQFNFKCVEIQNDEEVGWWFSNCDKWNGEEPYTMPVLRAAIHSFINEIPDICLKQKRILKDNHEVIEENLLNHPNAFNEKGLFFRKEEINERLGSLYIERDIIPQQGDMTDDEFLEEIEIHGRLDALIREVTTLLPPLESEKSGDAGDLNISSESLAVEDISEVSLINENQFLNSESIIIDVNKVEISEGNDKASSTIGVHGQSDSTVFSLEEAEVIEMPILLPEVELVEPILVSVEPIVQESIILEPLKINNVKPERKGQESCPLTSKILNRTNKKLGVLAGQYELF